MRVLLCGFRFFIMKRSIIYIVIVSVIAFLTFGFTMVSQIKIPFAKIEKTIRKQIGDQSFKLNSVVGLDDRLLHTEIFTIDVDNHTSGYVYVSRLNSCRAGGCAISSISGDPAFEYFDYFFITDSTGKVLKVTIYNYQATHGQQVMSRGWLKQFIGFRGDQKLYYGSDIQAISGATISAKAITVDIQEAESLIISMINK